MANYVRLEDGNIQINQTGEVLTEEEFDERFVICDICGDAVEKADGEYVCPSRSSWDIVCNDCRDAYLFKCYHCGNWEPRRNFVAFADSGLKYCCDCRSEYGYRCYECGELFLYKSSGEYAGDEWYCEDCLESKEGVLDDYHAFKDSGDFDFYGDETRGKTPYMGFELEVDSQQTSSLNMRKAVRYIQKEFGSFFHLENDGSLSRGFECISQPASLSYHLDRMPEYRQMFSEIVHNGFTSHANGHCGLHVHIDRTFFGKKEDASIAKMLFIFEKFWGELIKFSRRTENQVESWCGRYDKDVLGSVSEIVKKSKGYGLSRYYALNLTNSDTIEVRLWRGSLKPLTFEATLRFTDRLARLCRDTSAVTLWKMSWDDILGDDPVIKEYWDTVKTRGEG